MGVQGYLKHSSVIFPVRKPGVVFSWETHGALDPKAALILSRKVTVHFVDPNHGIPRSGGGGGGWWMRQAIFTV